MVIICGVFCGSVSRVYRWSVWFVETRVQAPPEVEIGMAGLGVA